MANPQWENGFTKLANEIIENLCLINLSPYESRVIWFVLRKTYGFQKKIDKISLSQFAEALQLDRNNVNRAIGRLIKKNMLVVSKDHNNHISYGLQKDYEKWKDVVCRDSVVSRDHSLQSVETTEVWSAETPSIERKKLLKKDIVPFKEIIGLLNEKTGKKFRYATAKYQACIRARWNEGFKTPDFEKVIENRVEKWGNDPKMAEYLRPETLFGTKFEGYLNDNGSKPQVGLQATPKEEIEGLYG